MKQSKVFIPTRRDVPAEAEALSHQLLLKAGLIKQSTSGIYSYLPLASRVLNNISKIIREEMESIDAVEILMPALQQAELWEESGRWGAYGPELMRLKDRNGREFALGPTHEEVVTSIVRDELKSYKQLPLTLFQIQSKFRDEKRPRFGLLRGREFIMKDAYSFHADEASLDETYQDMYNAYDRIFKRVGINARPVVADSGAIGGNHTHEFMALSEIGEDTIVYSEHSDYAANIEKAEVVYHPNEKHTEVAELEKVETPNVKTAQELADFLNRPVDEIVKSMIFKIDGEFIMFLIRGHHELNDVKVKAFFETDNVEMATQEEIVNLLGANPGSLGPVHDKDIRIFADNYVRDLNNLVVGANEDGSHYINANLDRDFKVDEFGDFRFILEGETLSDGSGEAKFAEGIEVGQVFKLGTKYSEAMNATFLDNQGKAKPLIMGCYGIGVSRTLSAIVEQNNDENGIIWPKSVTPFDLHLITINPKKDEQLELGDQLYKELQQQYDVLYDDRKDRAGVKFNDADLIGLPIRIVVGKNASEGIVEVKVRQTGESEEVHINDLNTHIATLYSNL
ncbi:proline--tRNA ligase [Staphylococcus sp. EG-SA-6]|jgi:prolyl-tRNA synthetase|uniref:Proline--tRNA ligase n=5 Tax=Staphylococcus haemolyticus TaxID=1283 RepID=SYP_STAHJ|nr:MULTISPECIES: proline--tRNA ligase [Staphylococcus]Q4L5W5.1 RecName: Full=Proline--tRNA ligase; AltName: Full=Prolyl-tRNA synthetase; Short=ProRS [Staphylococcus haemolyticus JCSC1435]KDP49501.1 proline--tRNA ligase [Staphylococcus aureus subsp. aureus CO-98]MBN4934617.1 proline--tRNA ligase [Staphylococcus sp. EG-SA-6]AKC76444.1 prolyl-tRNA synthetase [Staphylococcus haemolyticus]AMW23222.1 proline--tRNA ligase [Staphylococcus haemolyticus]AUV67706.1 proline--tRNA ligase [Staphylococcus h